MKKISILAVAFAFVGFGAQAQDNSATQPQQQTMQQEQENKQQIKPEELPEAVKLAVANSNYKEWTLGEVYMIAPTEEGATAVYEVQFLSEEEEPVVVRYDEAGNEMRS